MRVTRLLHPWASRRDERVSWRELRGHDYQGFSLIYSAGPIIYPMNLWAGAGNGHRGRDRGHVAHQCGEIYYLPVRETDYRSSLIRNLWFSLFAPHSKRNRDFSSGVYPFAPRWFAICSKSPSRSDKPDRSYLQVLPTKKNFITFLFRSRVTQSDLTRDDFFFSLKYFTSDI